MNGDCKVCGTWLEPEPDLHEIDDEELYWQCRRCGEVHVSR